MAEFSENFSFSCLTPEANRLISFFETPFPNDKVLSGSNTPAKFAKAGFVRNVMNAENDEVSCEVCKRAYRNWEGESPFAVHIIIDEHCPFLNTPSADDEIQNHPLVEEVRHGSLRFTADDNRIVENDNNKESHLVNSESQTDPKYPHVSILRTKATFSFPFQPKVGGVSMMFASRRLETFTDPGSGLCEKWAEEGFVFKPDTNEVQCVFCAVVLPFDSLDVQQMHAENSNLCPVVLMIDVGNITRENEERIQRKYLQQQQNQRSRSPTESQQFFPVCHPQYEEESHRLGTYENWPPGLCNLELQPSVMSEAGFWYTGCADKVRCFTCGLGLYQWKPGSNPWEQHALHMPDCPLLLQAKGQYFIQQAAQAQILTEVEFSPSERSEGGCPTREMLMAQLRASDANLIELCQQRAINHHQTALLEQKDIVNQKQSQLIQHKDDVIQHKEEIISHKNEQLQNKDDIIHHKNQLLEHKDQELQHKHQELLLHREELETCREVVRRQTAEVEGGRRLLEYQGRKISSLQAQVLAHSHTEEAQELAHSHTEEAQELAHSHTQEAQELAQRQQYGQQATALQAASPEAAAAAADGGETRAAVSRYLPCSVCLSAECNTLFRPCHHITCCQSCAQQLIDGKCPVCRAPVQGLLPAYIS